MKSSTGRRLAGSIAAALLSLIACGSGDPPAECNDGVPWNRRNSEPRPPGCTAIYNELCFTTTEAACACAGCRIEKCGIYESNPGLVVCE